MYKPEHAIALYDSLIDQNPGSLLYCLTDFKFSHPGIKLIPFVENWQHWWAKIELFRPDLFPGQSVFYMDLDTIVTGSIAHLGCKKFKMLRCVYNRDEVGSGVMAWTGDYSYLYRKFKEAPQRFINMYTKPSAWGDQGFIRDYLGFKPALFGDDVKSYKVNCRAGVPKGTSIVYFHGRPKPWEVKLRYL